MFTTIYFLAFQAHDTVKFSSATTKPHYTYNNNLFWSENNGNGDSKSVLQFALYTF